MPRLNEDLFQPVTIPNAAMDEQIKVFITYQMKHYAKETVKTYSKALQSFLSFILIDRNFKFRLADIERYAAYLGQKKQLSPATVSTYLTALRRFCEYLVECKELPRNPAKRIKGISNSKKLPIYFTQDELESLLYLGKEPTVTEFRDTLIMHLLLSCFLTEKEIHEAQVKDISENGQFILKNGNSLYIPQCVHQTMQSYIQMRFGESIPDPEIPLFESNSNRTKGQAISMRGIRNAIHQRISKVAISQERRVLLSAYTLRHTGGCLLAIAGFDEDQIMQRMRLKWKSTAMQYVYLKQEAIAAGLEQSIYLID
jgi:integrase/recombinase XerC/integrase/recombinase XerD